MINDVLKRVFNNIEPLLLEEIDSIYIEEVKKTYKQNIIDKYFEDYKSFENMDMLYSVIMEFEETFLKNLSINEKKSMFIKDSAFEQILIITNKCLELARERKENNSFCNISIMEECRKTFDENYPLVKDFNKDLADLYILEGMMDIEYACGKSANPSLRSIH